MSTIKSGQIEATQAENITAYNFNQALGAAGDT